MAVAEMQEGGRKDHGSFGKVLFISFLVHVACSMLVLSHRGGNYAMAPVPSFDLTMTAPQTAAVHPVPPAVGKEAVSLPEPPSQPAPSEYDKLRQESRKAVEATATPEAIRQVSLGLGITSGYFSSIANGQSLNDDIRDYYFTILQSINEKWWIDRENHAAGARNKVMINVVIGRDGNVVQSQIVRGSGSFTYDRSLLKALEAASPFPPLPERFRQAYFAAPLVFNPPLNLLDSSNNS